MEISEAIFTRRSVRKYKDIDIDQSLIDKILAAAMQAPSARNYQPWHFLYTKDKQQLASLSDIHPYGKMLASAGCAILVCGDLSIEPEMGYNALNCAAAIQNILLMAHALNLGAVWLGIFPRKDRMDDFTNFFELPDNIVPIGIVSIGYPDEKIDPINRFDALKIHQIKW